MQIAPFESTGREVSFEWSHHRILSTDSKVKTTLRDSNIHSGNESVKGKGNRNIAANCILEMLKPTDFTKHTFNSGLSFPDRQVQ